MEKKKPNGISFSIRFFGKDMPGGFECDNATVRIRKNIKRGIVPVGSPIVAHSVEEIGSAIKTIINRQGLQVMEQIEEATDPGEL